MSTQAVRIPIPLASDEIKVGIAKKMAEEFEQAVLASLGRTCSLNRQSYSKFSAKWSISFSLDDFGRSVDLGVIGAIGDVQDDSESVEGEVEPMPPDRFRRETEQKIPTPQVVQKKNDTELGITRVGRGRGRGRER